MSTVQLTLIARATAFAGTAEEKHFDNTLVVPVGGLNDDAQLDLAHDEVYEQARAYEAENAQTALFAQVEQANGKKLTKPQRELLILALSLQAGTHEPVEQSTETPPTDSNLKEQAETTSDSVEQADTETTSEESTEEVQSDGVDGGTEFTEEHEQKEEQSADELVQEAAQEAEKATGSDTDAGVEAALAALGL